MKKVFIFVFICIIIFLFFNYIFLKLGNNKISNKETRIEGILDKYLNYKAEMETIIYSNKTQNIYKIKQEVENQFSKMEINGATNISDVIIEKNNNILKITNSLLNVEKIYEQQYELLNNHLFLNVFVNDYKNNESNYIEKDNEIVFEVVLENNQNTYVKYKELVIDKKTYKPKELVIKDNTKETKVCIIYNNVEI